MRVYNRAMGGTSWASVEDYLDTGRALFYRTYLRLDMEDAEIYLDGDNAAVVPLDREGFPMKRLVCVGLMRTVPGPCPPEGDDCLDNPDDSTMLTLFGQRPCPPRPRCGYVYSGLECNTIQDIPISGTEGCGPWSRWAKIANIAGYTEIWCRSRVCNRERSVTQQCRIIWKKNCPPYDTRFGPWRRRICIITDTAKQYHCCPGQQSDPNQVGGCHSAGEFYLWGSWSPGGSNCSWQ